MTLDVAIHRASPLWKETPGLDRLIERAVLAAAAGAGVALQEGAEVSVQLADDRLIRALNAQWRGIDEPTNVLSFPAASAAALAAAPLLGDIVLGYETVRREAGELGFAFEDCVAHLVVHGFLHLIGFDHQTPAEADRMEKLETDILGEIGVADPYAATVAADETA